MYKDHRSKSKMAASELAKELTGDLDYDQLRIDSKALIQRYQEDVNKPPFGKAGRPSTLIEWIVLMNMSSRYTMTVDYMVDTLRDLEPRAYTGFFKLRQEFDAYREEEHRLHDEGVDHLRQSYRNHIEAGARKRGIPENEISAWVDEYINSHHPF